MATMPMYGKKPFKIFFLETSRLMTFKLCIQHQGLGSYKVCLNDDPRLSLTYFMAKSALLPNAIVWEKAFKIDSIKTIEVYELKVGSSN